MAGPARYDTIGRGYREYRRPDPRIAARIRAAVGDATSILNVGAGTGSYEAELDPRALVSVEPSAVMIEQRPPQAAPAVQGAAEHLPFASGTFDVALALLTVHHWNDLGGGLAELRRVSRRQVVLTIDTGVHDSLWLLREYVPAIAGMADGTPLHAVVDGLGAAQVEVVPTPADCTDGFLMAYWSRPERYLDPVVRANTSGFAMLDEADYAPGLAQLERDLADGTWQQRHADLLDLPECDAGLRLVIAG
jgi:SAM-dependent methyltransferase